MYGKITYTDVVNQVQEQGWKITAQTPDATTIEKPIGVPGMIAIPLSLIPIIGLLIGVLWINIRGKAVVTIERKLTLARVHTPGNEFDINTRDDLDIFFSNYNFKRNVGYYPVVLVGLVVLFIGGIVLQMLPPGA